MSGDDTRIFRSYGAHSYLGTVDDFADCYMPIIFHIAKREDWKQAEADRSYQPEMFSKEGFIHCSTAEQVIEVANFRFRGQTDLVLLAIDTDRVVQEIRYENLEGGSQLFPHIYGRLDPQAVVKVFEFSPQSDGYFHMPEEFWSAIGRHRF